MFYKKEEKDIAILYLISKLLFWFQNQKQLSSSYNNDTLSKIFSKNEIAIFTVV